MPTMRSITIALFFLTSLCLASHCPDARLRHVVIGGNTIHGSVFLDRKPLKSVQLRLYFSTGKAAWVGTTDEDGLFYIYDLRPDTYRLDVRGWGRTTITLDPKLSDDFGYNLRLMDNECTDVMESHN